MDVAASRLVGASLSETREALMHGVIRRRFDLADPKWNGQDAKVVTWTGCLRASSDGFDLTEVAEERPRDEGKKSRTPSMVMLRQVPATLQLQQYVGRRVAVTGATEDDVFEDIEVEVQAKRTAKHSSASDAKTKKTTTAEIEADPNGHNILVPVSIREISGACR